MVQAATWREDQATAKAASVKEAAMVERRDDPALFALFVALRDNVVRADAAANHANAIIRE